MVDRKSTRLNSSHTVIYTLSLHDALPISLVDRELWLVDKDHGCPEVEHADAGPLDEVRHRRHGRSEEHTSELQSHSDLHSFPTRRSSDLSRRPRALAGRQRSRLSRS